MAWLLALAVVILALVGVWLKFRGKLSLRAERFTFSDQGQDRPPPCNSAQSTKKVGEGTPSPPPPPGHVGEPPDLAPSPFAVWRSRPVFITSTFRDLHAERDYLHRGGLPRLGRAPQGPVPPPGAGGPALGGGDPHQEEPVDADEDARQQARELLILKICLDEIERSRPFIIGLLGDRYGSTPEEIPPVPHRPGALVFGEASLELVQ